MATPRPIHRFKNIDYSLRYRFVKCANNHYFNYRRKLLVSRRGVNHVARARAGRRESYTPGEHFAAAEDNPGTERAAESEPRFLRNL
ncbi:hypothetical protein NPIL_506051, partial [Nephila pilipes]